MTLIAAFSVGETPVLLGDIVTSTRLPGERRFVSPVLGEVVISPLVDEANGPSNFCRKIVRISDYLYVAWSGSRIGARAVAQDLRTRFGNAEVDFDEVNAFLESLDYKEAKEVSLIGICKSGAKVEIFGSRCMVDKNHPIVGPVYIAGSGFKHFSHSLDTLQTIKTEFDATHPLMAAGGLIGSFLSLEAHTGLTLRHHYGGGFETVAFRNGKFHRLPEATYLFWRFWHEGGNEVSFAMKSTAVKVSYRGDDLIIRRSSGILTSDDSRRTPATSSLFVIPPLLGSAKTTPATIDELPSLNSALTFHGFLIETDTKEITSFGYGEYKKKSIEFHEEHGIIRASLSEEFMGRLKKMAERYFGFFVR